MQTLLWTTNGDLQTLNGSILAGSGLEVFQNRIIRALQLSSGSISTFRVLDHIGRAPTKAKLREFSRELSTYLTDALYLDVPLDITITRADMNSINIEINIDIYAETPESMGFMYSSGTWKTNSPLTAPPLITGPVDVGPSNLMSR